MRATVIAAASVLLLAGLPDAARHATPSTLVLLGLVLLARSAPVAHSRDKAITFTGAAILTCALLAGGCVAGWCAMIASLLHARFLQHGGRPYAAFVGAQYVLAAYAADATQRALAFSHSAPAGSATRDILALLLAGLAFTAVNVGLVALGNLGTRYAHKRYWEPHILVQSLAVAVSLPVAVLIALAHRGGYGYSAAPFLFAILLICAHAVRMTVENRMLARQIEAVHKLGECCMSGVKAELPLRKFLELAREIVAFHKAFVWLNSDETGVLRATAAMPETLALPDSSAAAPDTILAWAAQRRKPALLTDIRRDPRMGPDAPAESWLLYPLYLQGHLLGLAQFVRSATRPFTQTDLARLETLVPQVTVAYQSAVVRQLMRRYENLAVTDGLTGLLNHRRTQDVLRAEMSRATRYGRPLSVMMIDVDGFKGFNDTYGHPQGDVLLRLMATLLRTNTRSVDHVGRYGGEEFLVILPETTSEDAYYLAERMRHVIETAGFPTGRDESVVMTVSVGVASFPEDAANAGDLVQRADEAMYQAKRSGKNRVLTA